MIPARKRSKRDNVRVGGERSAFKGKLRKRGNPGIAE